MALALKWVGTQLKRVLFLSMPIIHDIHHAVVQFNIAKSAHGVKYSFFKSWRKSGRLMIHCYSRKVIGYINPAATTLVKSQLFARFMVYFRDNFQLPRGTPWPRFLKSHPPEAPPSQRPKFLKPHPQSPTSKRPRLLKPLPSVLLCSDVAGESARKNWLCATDQCRSCCAEIWPPPALQWTWAGFGTELNTISWAASPATSKHTSFNLLAHMTQKIYMRKRKKDFTLNRLLTESSNTSFSQRLRSIAFRQ